MQSAEPDGIPCEPHIHDAGLSNRTAQLIERERRSYAGMAQALSGARKGIQAEEPVVTTAALHQAATQR